MFLTFCNINRKTPVLESLFNKVVLQLYQKETSAPMFSCYRTPPVVGAASILKALIKLNPLLPDVALPLGFLTFLGGIENQHWTVMG